MPSFVSVCRCGIEIGIKLPFTGFCTHKKHTYTHTYTHTIRKLFCDACEIKSRA